MLDCCGLAPQSGASGKLIMHIFPAERKFMLLSTAKLSRCCEEIVFEHLEQLALPNLDSDSQDSAFYRVETLYNTVVSVR